MLLLNTLYIADHRARISVKGRALEVRLEGNLRGRYPLGQLEAVILTGVGTMTTQAIERCVREGVRISAIGRSGALRFSIAGRTAGNVLLRVEQLRLADNADHSLQIARNVVAGKVQNQHRAIQRWHSSAASARERSFLDEQREVIASRLARVPSAPDLNYLRGLEGDATRRYFKAMRNHIHRVAPPMSFGERSRRPPRDPNECLDQLCGWARDDSMCRST